MTKSKAVMIITLAQKSASACTNEAPETAGICLLEIGKKRAPETSTTVRSVLLHPTSSTKVRAFGPFETKDRHQREEIEWKDIFTCRGVQAVSQKSG